MANDPYRPLNPDRTVTIKLEDNEIVVNPRTAVIRPGGVLAWDIQTGENSITEINFHAAQEVKGPFKREPSPQNPIRGRYLIKPSDPLVKTQPADAKRGYWKYDVTVNIGEATHYLDPGVVVKEGDGG